MTPHEHRGALFAGGMVALYAVVVALRELAIDTPLVVGTVGLLAVACGFCGAYFLARALGERVAP